VRSEVRVAQSAAEKIARIFGTERSAAGHPSEFDFWAGNGPLQAALIGFQDFENLRFESDPDVRYLIVVDPVLGPLVFVGELLEPGVVEIADFETDPDYWDMISDDPDD